MVSFPKIFLSKKTNIKQDIQYILRENSFESVENLRCFIEAKKAKPTFQNLIDLGVSYFFNNCDKEIYWDKLDILLGSGAKLKHTINNSFIFSEVYWRFKFANKPVDLAKTIERLIEAGLTTGYENRNKVNYEHDLLRYFLLAGRYDIAKLFLEAGASPTEAWTILVSETRQERIAGTCDLLMPYESLEHRHQVLIEAFSHNLDLVKFIIKNYQKYNIDLEKTDFAGKSIASYANEYFPKEFLLTIIGSSKKPRTIII